MEQFGNITVLFIAGFGPIVRDAAASQKLYHALGNPTLAQNERVGLPAILNLFPTRSSSLLQPA